MLVSAATRSVLLQSASPKRGQYVEDTPDHTVKFKGNRIVTETPDDMDETVFDTSQVEICFAILRQISLNRDFSRRFLKRLAENPSPYSKPNMAPPR